MTNAIGHNSKKVRAGGLAVDQLRSIVERVERLTEEKDGVVADIREMFAEARGNGYDVKALRKIIKLRSMDAGERDEEETILDTYRRALGLIPQLDLNLDLDEGSES